MESIITVEGKQVAVTTCCGDTQVMIDFAIVDTLQAYIDSERNGVNPWDEMASWKNPIAALKNIGAEALKIGRKAHDKGLRVFFCGSNEKRCRVYEALLRKHGIKCVMSLDEDGDMALEIVF